VSKLFTGIVEGLATVVSTRHLRGKTYSLQVRLGKTARSVRVGDSIAVNGVCLTVVNRTSGTCSFEVIKETLSRTDLGTLKQGSRVNIERSMTLNQRISGHFVMGHVDGTGKIRRITLQKDRSIKMEVATEKNLTSKMVEKGAVALDGISLTLVDVSERSFSVCLIPHTLKMTTLGIKGESDLVNIEADYIGKYVLKLTSQYQKSITNG